MAVRYICDQCGKTDDARHNSSGTVIMPAGDFDTSWVQWSEIDIGFKEFCSYRCLEKWRKRPHEAKIK